LLIANLSLCSAEEALRVAVGSRKVNGVGSNGRGGVGRNRKCAEDQRKGRKAQRRGAVQGGASSHAARRTSEAPKASHEPPVPGGARLLPSRPASRLPPTLTPNAELPGCAATATNIYNVSCWASPSAPRCCGHRDSSSGMWNSTADTRRLAADRRGVRAHLSPRFQHRHELVELGARG
jgi:hypothetical protein